MPKKNFSTREARKIIYDVNCYIQKESDEIVGKLKVVKNAAAAGTTTLQKGVEKAIQTLHLTEKRITSVPDQVILNDISNNLARTLEEAILNSKTNENELHSIISNVKRAQKRTALATKTSVATVRRIMTETRNSEIVTTSKTPGKIKQRGKPVTGIDSIEQGVIRRCLHNFHVTNKELPTVEKIRRKLQQDINFQGSEASLRRIIHDLGFRWKNIENNRKVLIETSSIRLQRIEYLKRIKKYRQEGRPIIYTDESYVELIHPNAKDWTDGSKGVKKPIAKGQRLVIALAGSETGFVPNALLTFKAGSKLGDSHDKIDYGKWLQEQVIPNIPPNSVVVIDNASYQALNKQFDNTPTPVSKRADMHAWLTERGILYDEKMLKPELYKLIKDNKGIKTFSVDKFMAEHNHDILRLPSYHPDLNPIKMAWSTIKQYVSSKNVHNLNNAIELVKEKVKIMGPQEWVILCNKVKLIEEEFVKNDHVIDNMTEQFIIRVSDSSSDSDHSQDEDEDEDSEMNDDDDEEPSTSIQYSHNNQQPSTFLVSDFLEVITSFPDD